MLEFQNNQVNKPKVRFDGVSEDYNDRDKDAILFFDGENFRLEKLHRAVKRLKYLRVPDESAAASRVVTKVVVPPVADTVKPVKMAQIDINNPVDFEEDVNIDDDDEDENDGEKPVREETKSTKEFQTGGLDIDINLPHPAEMEEDEIAVVDINDDELYKGLNAAEALRAQVNAEAREESGKSSSSGSGRESESSESGVESSGSGSSSSSGSRNSGSEGGTASESGSRASH
ncbi:Transcription elognation factor Eaf N-terminal [Arabidopsis thaliana x Arabidopsis arenosa]|nr:Transcription elognation factor Eaf N-terminal [Arabidopsis thaliana x Arabidopsis arenosa]